MKKLKWESDTWEPPPRQPAHKVYRSRFADVRISIGANNTVWANHAPSSTQIGGKSYSSLIAAKRSVPALLKELKMALAHKRLHLHIEIEKLDKTLSLLP